MCRRDRLKQLRQYYQCHKATIIQQMKQHYQDNKKAILDQKKQYYEIHKATILKRINQHYKNNKEIKISYEKQHYIEKYNSDPIFRLRKVLRARLKQAIKNNQRKGSAVRDLGCSIEFFKRYIEKKFHNNMTWNNWGEVWELDHIIPLCKFDLTKRSQLLKACHYTNLQPLSIEDHQKKTVLDIKEKYNG